MDFSFGQMVASSKESTLLTGSTDTVSSFGPMAAGTKESGVTADSTVRDRTELAKALKSLESGKMASGSDG